MWASAALNSDSGSDNDFAKGKKKKPTDYLLERIQKRLQSENFYDLNSSDEIGTPSPGRSGDASSSLYGGSQPQAYATQFSSTTRQHSGIVVPQAPSPPIISMQGESGTQSFSHDGSYPAQDAFKSASQSHRQSGGNMFNYASSSTTKQEASGRFGPPAKKPKTEADFSSTGGSGYPPSFSDFLAENFSVSSNDPDPYGKTQRPATTEKDARQFASAEYFSSKKSKFGSIESDGQSGRSNTAGYFALESSMVSSGHRKNSPHMDNRSTGSGGFVPTKRGGDFTAGNAQPAMENAQKYPSHQFSHASQSHQSFEREFQGNSSCSNPNFASRKLTSENNGGSSAWLAGESPFQSNSPNLSSRNRFGQSEDFTSSNDFQKKLQRNGSGNRDDQFNSVVHGVTNDSFRFSGKGGDKLHAAFSSNREDGESLFQNKRGSRGRSSSLRGRTGRGEPRDSFQSVSAGRGSHGAGGTSSVAYRQGVTSGDASWRSVSGGQEEFHVPCHDNVDSQVSFSGMQGDYGNFGRGRGNSRGSFGGGRGDPSSPQGGPRSIRGDPQGAFRGGRGNSRGFSVGGNVGRGGGPGTYTGANSERGISRGSFRGSRGVTSQPPRGEMTGPARGTSVSRGSGQEKRSSRGRGTMSFQAVKSESKKSPLTVPADVKMAGFNVVDSYKSSISSSEDYSSLPLEALQCSVCTMRNFKSASAFKEHVESQHHGHMLTLLAARNDSLEQFIKMGSKLASRALEHEVISNSVGEKDKPNCQDSKFIMCGFCNCSVLRSAVPMHNQLIQHKELVEFSKPLCCGIKFTKRQAYEAHKVTKKHLTNKYQFEKLFIVNAVLAIEKDLLKSRLADRSTSEKSSSLKHSEYVLKVLQLLETIPLIENEKEDYCLACEVSVPKFRRSFHPSCSDHHASTVVFAAENKTRLTARITQYLKEVRSSVRQPVPGQTAPGVTPSVPAITATQSLAASNSPCTEPSATVVKMESLPAPSKDSISSEKKASKPSDDKSKIEEPLGKEEKEAIDDEFDYEFANVDDDTGKKLAKNEDKKSVEKEHKETQDNGEECVDDEFAYEYDVSLSSSNTQSTGEKLVPTKATFKAPGGKKVEAPEDDGDDFEYECTSNAGDSKLLKKDSTSSKIVALEHEVPKEEEVEEEIDEFDYQFEPAVESHHDSSKKPESPEVDDDETDGFLYEMDAVDSSGKAKKVLAQDKVESEDADDDNEEEFEYELTDVNNDSAPMKESSDVNLDDEKFEYEMEVDQSNKESAEEEEDGCEDDDGGFEYDLPPDSPKEAILLEDVNENNENSNDEVAFDYDMPDDKNSAKESNKKDAGASTVKNSERSPVLSHKKNEKETVNAPVTKTCEDNDLVEEFDYEVLQEDSRNAELEADDDEFEYQCPTANTKAQNEIEPKAKSTIKGAPAIASEVEVSKVITISDSENVEEEGVAETPSSKLKRPRKTSGSDEASEVKAVPESFANTGTRPKRRSIAPIRFK